MPGILNSLLGPESSTSTTASSPSSGILNMLSSPQMAAAAALLESSGEQVGPGTSTGQALGRALTAAGQAQTANQSRALQTQLLQKELERGSKREEIELAKNFTPESIAEARKTGDFSKLTPRIGSTEAPAAVREFQFFKSLDPEGQAEYQNLKRAGRIQDVAGVGLVKVDPSGQSTVLVPDSTITDGEAGRAFAKETATQDAKTGAIVDQVSLASRTKRQEGFIDDGISAADSLPTIKRARELLDTVETGGLAAAQLAATNLLGVTGADEAELSNNLGKAVLSQLRTTFGAAFTEREGARLDRIEANFGKSVAGNKRLLEQAQKIIERAAQRGIKAADDLGDSASADEIRQALDFSLSTESKRKVVKFEDL